MPVDTSPAPHDPRPDPPPPVDIGPAEERALLHLARQALEAATRAPTAGDLVASLEPALRQAREALHGSGPTAAVFVTLTVAGALRGCIGSLDRHQPVLQAVASATISAALHDPRFRPVALDETASIQIEISVLGPSIDLPGLDAFQPGRDGILVEVGGRRGLLLPGVAIEFDWGAAEMVVAACRKAGLSSDAWREPGARVSIFRTLTFGERG